MKVQHNSELLLDSYLACCLPPAFPVWDLTHLQALSPELAETCSHHSPRGETILPTCQAFLRYSHGHQPWSIWEENGRGREASVLHPRSHLRGRALFPQSQLERDAGTPLASCQHLPQGPRRPSTLTGDVEPDGCLQGHLRSLECHPTGEVGAVVLGPWGDPRLLPGTLGNFPGCL